jgi:hypothetical protein
VRIATLRGARVHLFAQLLPDLIGDGTLGLRIQFGVADLRDRLIQHLVEISGLSVHDSSPT